MKWLQNKNRTDPPKITNETLKDAQDQFDFVFLIFFTEFILPGKLFRVIKKSSARKKLKIFLKDNFSDNKKSNIK